MFQNILSLFRRDRRRRPCKAGSHQVHLGVEHLEDRLVPAITDMTALALSQIGTPPSTPQLLLLNFDGWTNSPVTGSSISAFSGTQKQIDDIIYQVSEIYAPFNVVVEQIHDNGAYESAAAVAGEPGPTTIFIGGDPNNVGSSGKYAYSQTPAQFVDYPHPSDPNHLLHSDPYNIGFVDPVSVTNGSPSAPWNGNYSWVAVQSDTQIAENIAHEAGHTFGLAHVLSSPTADIMSYDVFPGQFFANQTFSITDLNNSGTTTAANTAVNVDWQGTILTTQDSYTYLGTVLGYRANDGIAHIVDNGDVDQTSYHLSTLWGDGGPLLSAPNYDLGNTATGSLTAGDFSVYKMTASATATVDITLAQHNGTWYNSLELLVYDNSGNLITTVDGPFNGNVQSTLSVVAGQTYNFVVGTAGADSNGQYSFQVTEVPGIWNTPIHLPNGGGGGQSTPAPANLVAVATALTHSAESFGDFITNAYQQYLGRAPSNAEVNGWVTDMQNGTTDEQVEAGFIGSTEYIQDHGGAGAGWVTGMYQDLLGRTPSQAEVDGWVQNLNNGMSATAVAYGFAASTEREGDRVAADYLKYLGRAASQAEINGWVSDFEAGFTNENVIAGFVGSTEFWQDNGSDATQWLDAAYEDIFGRSADAAADAAWLPVL